MGSAFPGFFFCCCLFSRSSKHFNFFRHMHTTHTVWALNFSDSVNESALFLPSIITSDCTECVLHMLRYGGGGCDNLRSSQNRMVSCCASVARNTHPYGSVILQYAPNEPPNGIRLPLPTASGIFLEFVKCTSAGGRAWIPIPSYWCLLMSTYAHKYSQSAVC